MSHHIKERTSLKEILRKTLFNILHTIKLILAKLPYCKFHIPFTILNNFFFFFYNTYTTSITNQASRQTLSQLHQVHRHSHMNRGIPESSEAGCRALILILYFLEAPVPFPELESELSDALGEQTSSYALPI